MSVRKHIVAIALVTLAAPAAFAQGSAVFVGGEAGWIDPPMASRLTRDQVRSEYLRFRSNPVAADGGLYVGGEAGYLFPAHTYALVDGHWVCTDKIAHNPAPDAIRSAPEEKLFQQLYPA